MTTAIKQYLFGAGCIALSMFFYYYSAKLPHSAALLPIIVTSLVLLLSIAMIVNAYRDDHSEKFKAEEAAKAKEDKAGPGTSFVRVVVFTALIGLYIYLMPTIGYFIITPLYVIATYMYLKATSFIKAAVISVAFSAFIYFLFVAFLKLPIPLGLMERFFE